MPHRWDDIADVRRKQIESGQDLTFSRVFLPLYASLVSELKPSRLLEVGGGTGHLAQALASIPNRYVMIEPSAGMFEVARQTLSDTNVEVYNHSIESFQGDERFDLILSHLCLQVADDLPSFLSGVSRHLSHDGFFLLSLPHPVFYNDYKMFFPVERFRYIEEQSDKVSFAITLDPNEKIEGVPYHHRPLSKYVSEVAPQI